MIRKSMLPYRSLLSGHMLLYCRSARLVLRSVGFHLFFWLLAGTVYYLLIKEIKSPPDAEMRMIVNVSSMALLFYTARSLTFRFYENGLRRRWLALLLTTSVLIAGCRALVEIHVFKTTAFHVGIIQFNKRLSFIVFLFFLVLSLLFLALSSLYYISKRRSVIEHQLYNAEFRHLEAQLMLLKAQLNPHFLFNTLNNIYAAALLGSERTPDMILKLSEILHFVTHKTKEKQILISMEVEQVHNYIQLHQMMAAAPLPVDLTLDLPAEDLLIPPMLILPLIENAFKHSNVTSGHPGSFLRMELHHTNHELLVSIVNSCDCRRKKCGNGVGIQNLRERLELEYPNRHQLSIEQTEKQYELLLTIRFL